MIKTWKDFKNNLSNKGKWPLWLWYLSWPIRINLVLKKSFFDGPKVFNYPGRKHKSNRSANMLVYLWLQALMKSYLTVPGRVLFLITFALFLEGLATILIPVYILSFTLVSFYILDCLVGFIFKPKLKIDRQVPDLVLAGESFEMSYKIENIKALPAWELIVDVIPANGLELPDGYQRIHKLLKGEKAKLKNKMNFNQRGVYTLPMCIVGASFPFGLWRWCDVDCPGQTIKVYPQFNRLNSIDLSFGNLGLEGEESKMATGSSLEFSSLRPFQYGDDPKLIHARSWAKYQEPVIKEFTSEANSKAAIIVDNFKLNQEWVLLKFMNKKTRALDASMSLLCAMCEFLINQKYLCDIYVPGHEFAELRNLKNHSDLESVFELSAEIKTTSKSDFYPPDKDQIKALKNVNYIFLLALTLDKNRQSFIDELIEINPSVKLILVNGQKEQYSNIVPTQILDPEDILNEKISDI